MKYNQITRVVLNLLTSKQAIESSLIREFKESDLDLLGYINYIDLHLDNLTSNYKRIKDYIEIFYFKTKDVPDWWENPEDENLTDLLLGCTEEKANDVYVLTKNLPKLVVDFIQRSDSLEEELHKGFNMFFPSLKKYKLIEGEMIEMTEDEINKYDVEKQIEAINAAYSVDNWESFYLKLIGLIKEEKYTEILKHLAI